MSDESNRFRMRARQCRLLAQDARDESERQTLSRMADELDHEAHQIEAAERKQQPLG